MDKELKEGKVVFIGQGTAGLINKIITTQPTLDKDIDEVEIETVGRNLFDAKLNMEYAPNEIQQLFIKTPIVQYNEFMEVIQQALLDSKKKIEELEEEKQTDWLIAQSTMEIFYNQECDKSRKLQDKINKFIRVVKEFKTLDPEYEQADLDNIEMFISKINQILEVNNND